MKHLYIFIFTIIVLMLSTSPANAQVSEETPSKELSIKNLSIYPNPAPAGQKVFIVTPSNDVKEIEIFNALGKRTLSVKMGGNEFDTSSLDPGIYILKIKEGNRTATRKLVIQ